MKGLPLNSFFLFHFDRKCVGPEKNIKKNRRKFPSPPGAFLLSSFQLRFFPPSVLVFLGVFNVLKFKSSFVKTEQVDRQDLSSELSTTFL